jgi:HD-like signal output (HDOD) protein
MAQEQLVMRIAVLLAAILLVMLVVLIARLRGRRAERRNDEPWNFLPGQAAGAATTFGNGQSIPYADQTLEIMVLEVYRKAFGTTNFNYAVLGEHEAVMASVRASLARAVGEREFFPRKPLIIPRLLAAMKNSESSLKELVEIIMQDPVLTGDVLRMANSSFYRIGKEPIDTLGRAVVLLGMEGLRSLVASTVMQPVFQVPRGYFEQFSVTVWSLAQRSALGAQAYARLTRECDSFSAHLLSLLYYLGYIVLFRLTVSTYQQASGSLPRAEVFTRLIDERAEVLAGLIAKEWELPAPMRDALSEHTARRDVESMSPLARALYFGRLCGMASLLAEELQQDPAELLALLERKGLNASEAQTLWNGTLKPRPGQPG